MADKPLANRASIWKNSMDRIRESARGSDCIRATVRYQDMHGNGILLRGLQAESDLLKWALLQNIRKTNSWIRRLVEINHGGPKPGSMRGLPF
ncbi:MAG: hypothetical protein HPY65_08965 [Syntrophaceae bacterium]|nr:hypothetical protein [Syntrophaceae bacterium]